MHAICTYILPKFKQAAARSLCDSWTSCFYQVRPSSTYQCLNYSVFDSGTLCQAVTLTFDLLTLKVRRTSNVTCSKSVRNFSKIEQSPAELLIILRIFAHVITFDLDIWPLNLGILQHFGCHACKLCTNTTIFERNRIIHSWVMDDLARFRVQF